MNNKLSNPLITKARRVNKRIATPLKHVTRLFFVVLAASLVSKATAQNSSNYTGNITGRTFFSFKADASMRFNFTKTSSIQIPKPGSGKKTVPVIGLLERDIVAKDEINLVFTIFIDHKFWGDGFRTQLHHIFENPSLAEAAMGDKPDIPRLLAASDAFSVTNTEDNSQSHIFGNSFSTKGFVEYFTEFDYIFYNTGDEILATRSLGSNNDVMSKLPLSQGGTFKIFERIDPIIDPNGKSMVNITLTFPNDPKTIKKLSDPSVLHYYFYGCFVFQCIMYVIINRICENKKLTPFYGPLTCGFYGLSCTDALIRISQVYSFTQRLVAYAMFFNVLILLVGKFKTEDTEGKKWVFKLGGSRNKGKNPPEVEDGEEEEEKEEAEGEELKAKEGDEEDQETAKQSKEPVRTVTMTAENETISLAVESQYGTETEMGEDSSSDDSSSSDDDGFDDKEVGQEIREGIWGYLNIEKPWGLLYFFFWAPVIFLLNITIPELIASVVLLAGNISIALEHVIYIKNPLKTTLTFLAKLPYSILLYYLCFVDNGYPLPYHGDRGTLELVFFGLSTLALGGVVGYDYWVYRGQVKEETNYDENIVDDEGYNKV